MKTTYHLLDVDSGNIQGIYTSLLEALQVVRDAVERDGNETLKDLVLYESRADGGVRAIAQEEELLPLIGKEPVVRS